MELAMPNRHFLMTLLAALLLTGASVTLVSAQSSADQLSADQSSEDQPSAEITPPENSSTIDPDYAAQRRPAPSCVVIDGQETKYLTARNQCSTQQRIKSIIAWGPDSACYTLTPGSTIEFWWNLGRFDGLTSC
jgi:hypothetical protein